MNMMKFLGWIWVLLFGIFMVVYGGYDDSPGGQLLGLFAVVSSIVGILKTRKKKYHNKTSTTSYKHTQIGYLMLVVTLAVVVIFAWIQITARAEPPSVDSGTNFAVTALMTLIIFILVSVTTLTVSIDEKYLRIKFGYGIFRKKFLLSEIVSAEAVKNPWYYGWGIRLWLWPTVWIYNISGFAAVEIVLKNKKKYRIGTDVPEELASAIKASI